MGIAGFFLELVEIAIHGYATLVTRSDAPSLSHGFPIAFARARFLRGGHVSCNQSSFQDVYPLL